MRIWWKVYVLPLIKKFYEEHESIKSLIVSKKQGFSGKFMLEHNKCKKKCGLTLKSLKQVKTN